MMQRIQTETCEVSYQPETVTPLLHFFQPVQQSSCDGAVFLPIDVGHCVAPARFANESTTGWKCEGWLSHDMVALSMFNLWFHFFLPRISMHQVFRRWVWIFQGLKASWVRPCSWTSWWNQPFVSKDECLSRCSCWTWSKTWVCLKLGHPSTG